MSGLFIIIHATAPAHAPPPLTHKPPQPAPLPNPNPQPPSCAGHGSEPGQGPGQGLGMEGAGTGQGPGTGVGVEGQGEHGGGTPERGSSIVCEAHPAHPAYKRVSEGEGDESDHRRYMHPYLCSYYSLLLFILYLFNVYSCVNICSLCPRGRGGKSTAVGECEQAGGRLCCAPGGGG